MILCNENAVAKSTKFDYLFSNVYCSDNIFLTTCGSMGAFHSTIVRESVNVCAFLFGCSAYWFVCGALCFRGCTGFDSHKRHQILLIHLPKDITFSPSLSLLLPLHQHSELTFYRHGTDGCMCACRCLCVCECVHVCVCTCACDGQVICACLSVSVALVFCIICKCCS